MPQAKKIKRYKNDLIILLNWFSKIKGNFLNYIKFKRAVSRSKKMLNFDKELINVVQNDPNGAVVATGELTIVGLPNEFF